MSPRGRPPALLSRRRPVTAAPVTAAPVTADPVTVAPVAAAPVTADPVTVAPVTAARVTALGLVLLLSAAAAACGGTSSPTTTGSTTTGSTTTGSTTTGSATTGSATTSLASPTSGAPGSGTTEPGNRGNEGIPAFSHLFVVLMENEERSGALAAPSIAALARRYASAQDWYAVAHPSLPNYLAITSGSTWGVTSDCTTCDQPGPDLATQLTTAGITWGAYMEDLPAPCFLGPQSPNGLYAEKHDPFAYFDDVRADAALCDRIQPLSALTPLLAPGVPESAVPRFVWVTPNLCDDGHNCSAQASGVWLTGFVDTVTTSAAWRDGGAMVVTWDEGATDAGIDPATGALSSSGGGGNVLTLVIAPGLRAGLEVDTPYDHYSLLRTIEDAFGLPLLGAAADASTTPMSAFWPPAAAARS